MAKKTNSQKDENKKESRREKGAWNPKIGKYLDREVFERLDKKTRESINEEFRRTGDLSMIVEYY